MMRSRWAVFRVFIWPVIAQIGIAWILGTPAGGLIVAIGLNILLMSVIVTWRPEARAVATPPAEASEREGGQASER